MKLSLTSVRLTLRAFGMVIRKDSSNDYRVNYKGYGESTAYYTNSLRDALETGKKMADKRPKAPWETKSLAIALLLMVLVVSGVAQTPTQTLAFTSSRDLLLVQVTIDGVERTMVFDTGAQRTIIDDPANVERNVNVVVGKRTMRMYIAYAPLHINASETVKGVKATGLLGQDVLRSFKHVSFDYTNKTITME